MHLFQIIALDVDSIPAVSVFAESYDLAVHQYVMWWLHHRNGDLPDLEVRKRNPTWPGLDVGLLADALKLNSSGVGLLNADKGWTIYSPGHEAVGDL